MCFVFQGVCEASFMDPLPRHSTKSEDTWALAMWIGLAGPSMGELRLWKVATNL